MIPNSNTPGEKESTDKSQDDQNDAIQPEKDQTDTNDPRIETVVPDNDN